MSAYRVRVGTATGGRTHLWEKNGSDLRKDLQMHPPWTEYGFFLGASRETPYYRGVVQYEVGCLHFHHIEEDSPVLGQDNRLQECRESYEGVFHDEVVGCSREWGVIQDTNGTIQDIVGCFKIVP